MTTEKLTPTFQPRASKISSRVVRDQLAARSEETARRNRSRTARRRDTSARGGAGTSRRSRHPRGGGRPGRSAASRRAPRGGGGSRRARAGGRPSGDRRPRPAAAKSSETPKSARERGTARPRAAYGSRLSSAAPGLRDASICATRFTKAIRTAGIRFRKCSRVEVLVRRRKGVLLEEKSAREDAEGLAGRAAPVPRDGSRLGEDAAPEDPLAPSEVHVFEVGEVVVVEAAGLQELAPPHGHQASGGEEALLAGSRLGKRFDRPPDVGRERVAVEGQEPVREIVAPPGPVGQPAPDGGDVFGGRRRGPRPAACGASGSTAASSLTKSTIGARAASTTEPAAGREADVSRRRDPAHRADACGGSRPAGAPDALSTSRISSRQALAGRGLESRERLEQMFEPAVMDDDGGRLGCLGDLHCGEDYLEDSREEGAASSIRGARRRSGSRPGSTRALRGTTRAAAPRRSPTRAPRRTSAPPSPWLSAAGRREAGPIPIRPDRARRDRTRSPRRPTASSRASVPPATATRGHAAPGRVEQPRAVRELGLQAFRGDRNRRDPRRRRDRRARRKAARARTRSTGPRDRSSSRRVRAASKTPWGVVSGFGLSKNRRRASGTRFAGPPARRTSSSPGSYQS